MEKTIDAGRNFNEEPLSFEEFIDMEGREVPIYTNFFLGFYNYQKGVARNYQRLKKVGKKLAIELSTVFYRYHRSGIEINEVLVKGHGYPMEILEKGYQAYIILRKTYKKDKSLLESIKDYKSPYPGYKISDDWAAFFC